MGCKKALMTFEYGKELGLLMLCMSWNGFWSGRRYMCRIRVGIEGSIVNDGELIDGMVGLTRDVGL